MKKLLCMILSIAVFATSGTIFPASAETVTTKDTTDVKTSMGLTYNVTDKVSGYQGQFNDDDFKALNDWSESDGTVSTRTMAYAPTATGEWVLPSCILDLKSVSSVNAFIVYGQTDKDAGKCTFEYSVDKNTWYPISVSQTAVAAASNTDYYIPNTGMLLSKLETPVVARYIRVTMGTTKYKVQILELCVFGEPINTFLESVEFEPENGELSPSFNRNIKEYVLYIDDLNVLPVLSAIPSDDVNCETTIVQASAENGYCAQVIVASKEYSDSKSIYTFRYKLLTPDSSLSNLSASSGLLKPQFNKNITEYVLEVGSLDSLPELSASASLDSSNVEIIPADEENGYAATIIVTSKQQTTTTYTVKYNIPEFYTSPGLSYTIHSYEADGSNMSTIGDWEGLCEMVSGGNHYKSGNKATVRPWAILDLGRFYYISDLVMYHTTATDGQVPTEYQYSVDGKTWYDFTGKTNGLSNTQDTYYKKNRLLRHFISDKEQLARFVKVTLSATDAGLLNPMKLLIYGREADVTLESLTLENAELRPQFSPTNLEYEVFVSSFIEEIPEIQATLPQGSENEIEIIQASEANNYCATIKVVTPNNYDVTYSFKYNEYSPTSAELKALMLSFAEEEPFLIDSFDKNVTEYVYYIDDVNSIPTVIAETDNPEARIENIVQANKKYTVATIDVVAADGTNRKKYVVRFASNIALNRSVWAPTSYSGYSPSYAVDGKMNTMYYSSTAIKSNGYFNIDLGAVSDVYAIKLYQNQTDKPASFSNLSISEDGSVWTRVEDTTLKLISTNDGLYGMEFKFDELPLSTKYLQISGEENINDKMRLSELEIYGVRPAAVSSNCLIKTIELSSGNIRGFSKYINSYTVQLGANEPIPTIISAEAEDTYASVSIVQATESNPVATVTVLAENGTSKSVYSICFEKQLAPEKNTYLSSLAFTKGTLLPAFSSANTAYTLYLTPGETVAEENITAATAVSGASVNITVGNPVLVKVTSSDGTEERTYTISTEYAEADLGGLTVTGYEIKPAFSPAVTDYSIELQPDEEIPLLGVDFGGKIINPVAASGTTISIVQATAENPKAFITVENDNGILKKTYTISFNYVQSLKKAYDSAQLALRDFEVTNNTTADDILQLIKNSVTNEEIDVNWSTSFSKKQSTTVDTGLITGAITLKLGEESVVISIRKSIAKESGGPGGGSSGGGGGGGGSTPDSSEKEDSNKEEKPPVVTDKYQEIRNHWAEKEVIYLAENGIVEGNGSSFALEDTVTRAEFVTMLIRAGKFDVVAYTNSFDDVSENDWYSQYIQTAFNNGFISGYDGKVNPTNTTTREEAVKMLVGVYENMNGEIIVGDEKTFADSSSISEWAEAYVQKSVTANLVQGFDTGEFKAKDTLTRAQAMVMIYRLIVNE